MAFYIVGDYMINLMRGNCLETMKDLPDNSIDSIVTDPPYGLSFMGKSWDYDVPTKEIWRECLRVLKPGGHLLAFFGTRTYHRGVVRIEDAGFEIRDCIQWLYGSGFPKSHNIKEGDFKGWGTALKPANEPICAARKPLEKGLTVTENVQKWGTGAINIDGSRIGLNGGKPNVIGTLDYQDKTDKNGTAKFRTKNVIHDDTIRGRWPANIILDEEAAAALDEQSGVTKSGAMKREVGSYNGESVTKMLRGKSGPSNQHGDSGGASRFFYVAKASKAERGEGNNHPTVKPIKLMEYLIKLVTPPNGIVLDPFMGSGSTGVAAKQLGFSFIGCELSADYFEIAEKRIINENHSQLGT